MSEAMSVLRAAARSLALNVPPLRSLYQQMRSATIERAKLREMIVGQDETIAAQRREISRLQQWIACHLKATCPVCETPETRVCADITLHHGVAASILECAECAHKFVFPPPSATEIASWYQGEGYFHQNCAHQGIRSSELTKEWDGFIHTRMSALQTHVIERFGLRGQLRICEIGCLEGAFLKKLSLLGHHVHGYEINADVVEMARKSHDIDIECADVETVDISAIEPFDVIMSFHTFEHLRSPAAVLKKAAAMLRPGGCVLLEVPADDDEMDNGDHLQFFSERSLKRLMDRELVDVQLSPNHYMRGGSYLLGSLYAVGRRA